MINTTPDEVDIVIIGAGIAGLALAAALDRSKFQVLILDRRMQMKDINRGDTLFPATIRTLSKMGLMGDIVKSGAIKNPSVEVFFKNISLQTVQISDVDLTEPFIYTIHHENLESAIYEKISSSTNVTFDMGSSFLDVNDFTDYALVKIHDNSGERIIKTKLLVGSDGRNSMVRQKIGISPSISTYKDTALIFIVMVKEGTDTLSKLFIDKYVISTAPISENKMRISLLVHDKNVMILEKMQIEDLKKYFISINKYFECIETFTKETHFYKLIGYNLDHYFKGNVVLIGDAAHTSHPLEGHGMAQAINDGFLLSEALKESINIKAAVLKFDINAFYHNNSIFQKQKIFRILYQIYITHPILSVFAGILIKLPGARLILKYCIIRMFTQ